MKLNLVSKASTFYLLLASLFLVGTIRTAPVKHPVGQLDVLAGKSSPAAKILKRQASEGVNWMEKLFNRLPTATESKTLNFVTQEEGKPKVWHHHHFYKSPDRTNPDIVLEARYVSKSVHQQEFPEKPSSMAGGILGSKFDENKPLLGQEHGHFFDIRRDRDLSKYNTLVERVGKKREQAESSSSQPEFAQVSRPRKGNKGNRRSRQAKAP